jgi:hypothetical protein
MTYMRSWKSHRLTSYRWLGLNPHIGRPLSRIVGAIGFFLCVLITHKSDFYTQSVVLTRMSVIINFVSVIITLIRVNITQCV